MSGRYGLCGQLRSRCVKGVGAPAVRRGGDETASSASRPTLRFGGRCDGDHRPRSTWRCDRRPCPRRVARAGRECILCLRLGDGLCRRPRVDVGVLRVGSQSPFTSLIGAPPSPRARPSAHRHVSEDQRAHPGCVPGGHFLARAARARVRRADALLERFSHVAPGPTSGDHLSAGRRASSGSRRRSGLQIPLGPARGTTKHRDATRTKCITSANSWNQRHFLQFPVHLDNNQKPPSRAMLLNRL